MVGDGCLQDFSVSPSPLGTEWVVELTRPPGVDKVKAKVWFKYSSPMIFSVSPSPLGTNFVFELG